MDRKTENEKKKDYLWGYQRALRKQKELEEEICQLRLDTMVPSLIQDGMPHGSGGGDLSGYMAKVDELLNELDKLATETINLRREISQKIEWVENETENTVLRYRYILKKSFLEIANNMGYSYDHILRVHGEALKHFKI